MRPDCYYCDGTGTDDEAVRIDVDDYRAGKCELCEGTGEAMHSANTDTTYRYRDPLLALRDNRSFGRKRLAAYKAGTALDDGRDVYLNVKRHAIGKPVKLPAWPKPTPAFDIVRFANGLLGGNQREIAAALGVAA